MITTYKEASETLGLKQGEMQDCDLWIGRNGIRHATGIMLVDNGYIYMRCDKIAYRKSGATSEEKTFFKIEDAENCLMDYEEKPDEKIVLAFSFEEARNHAFAITNEETHLQNTVRDEVLNLFVTLSEKLTELDGDIKDDIAETILDDDDDRFETLRSFIEYRMGWYKEDERFNEDVQVEMMNIFQRRKIVFRDSEHGNICTTVELGNVVSVNTNVTVNKKDCVIVHTNSDRHTYRIFKENNKDVYYALEHLYY